MVGNNPDVFPNDKLKELCPAEWAAFVAACKIAAEDEDGIEDDEFYVFQEAGDLQYEGGETSVPENVAVAWLNLKAVFNAATGLDLYLGYHDAEGNGDRYDEVDGLYFPVDGMYELTEAGKRWQGIVEQKQFVELC